eukprot:CAMPEP_0174902744 /NCGR_PEP_ID=MMETSP0167-20121228/39596_1 /TAXON_ID=38298 /ORGANISM="Rhodella maculata, Strain CCMP736" /LENGTH=42 /DNA_ID= /DNA_START= /DNA_END= /DNA_ORIENTATION=
MTRPGQPSAIEVGDGECVSILEGRAESQEAEWIVERRGTGMG